MAKGMTGLNTPLGMLAGRKKKRRIPGAPKRGVIGVPTMPMRGGMRGKMGMGM